MADFTAGNVLTAAQLDTAFNTYTIRDVSTTSATLGAADAGGMVNVNNNSGGTVTIPLNSTWAAETGTRVVAFNGGTAGTWTLAGTGGVTYTGPASLAIGESVEVFKTATNTWWGRKPAGVTSGLTLITAQTFTTASAVNINNCFTSTHSDYLVTFTLTAVSAQTAMNIRMRASGTDNSSANYVEQTLGGYTSTAFTSLSAGATSWSPFSVNTTYPRAVASVFLSNPQAAAETQGHSEIFFFASSGLANTYQRNVGGLLYAATTQFDGISMYPASGTITGVIRVYGYQNS